MSVMCGKSKENKSKRHSVSVEEWRKCDLKTKNTNENKNSNEKTKKNNNDDKRCARRIV